ncbi:MAG: hypothetical protein AMXMBFR57_28850 [Acidimicrobiia bacterium]
MRGTLVDSNVLFDILSDDAEWADWSADAAHQGPETLRHVPAEAVADRPVTR